MAQNIEFHRDGDCLWVVVRAATGDLTGSPEVIALKTEIEQCGITRVIVDLSHLHYFGSAVLEFLVVLWRRVGRNEGRLILHKPSIIGREVLASSRLEQIWPIAQSPQEAFHLARAAEEPA